VSLNNITASSVSNPLTAPCSGSPGILDHPTQIHDIGINTGVPQAVTHSSGDDTFIGHLELNDNSLLNWILDNSGDHSTMNISSNENTGVTLPSVVRMNDVSTLSIGQGLQVSLDPGSYSGGGTGRTAPPESLPDNPIEHGMNVTNISAEASVVRMNDVSTLSIGQGLQVSLDPGSYSGGGTAPPESLPDNPIEHGMNVTNISAEASEGVPTQHSMAENSGVDGGASIKKPSKMRPGNTLTPR
jgi:hypothetical protein